MGDSNKFYYDENIKRWIEEGAKLSNVELPLCTPLTTAAFQNGAPDYNIKSALITKSSICNNGFLKMKSPISVNNGMGISPLPPTSNQFLDHSCMGPVKASDFDMIIIFR